MALTGFLIAALAVFLKPIYGSGFNVDMERTDTCTLSQPVTVNQYDVFNIFANPPQDGRGTRDRCTVKFVSSDGSNFKLFIRRLVFRECQVFIKMYDGDMNLNTPRYKFGCEQGPNGLYYSTTSEVAISLEKPDASGTGYSFYLVLARVDGPDIGGEDIGEPTAPKGLSTGAIIGIAIGIVVFIVIIILVTVYVFYVQRRKKEEKELHKELASSRSTLFASTFGTARGGSSVHSSVHSSHHSTHSTHSTHNTANNKENKAFVYPAFRTKPSISDKATKCNSIDTLTNSEGVDSVSNYNETDGRSKSKPLKDVNREFDSMRRGLLRDKRRDEMEKEDLRRQEISRQEARNFDRQGRAESNRGLGRSNRQRTLISNSNIKGSLREARSKGRPLTDSHSRGHKDSGSVRSSKSKNRSHSPARSAHSTYDYRDEVDYYSDDNRLRGRDRSRSTTNDRSRPRSSSTGSHVHRRRDNYTDRDNYSDCDDRRGYHSRDRYDDDYDDRRSRQDSSGHRSTSHRARSQSAGRRQR